jgi:hypothetical protein
VQVPDQREDVFSGLRVEVAGGFVGEQDRRIDREGAGDGDALALAPGQLVGQVVQAVRELHERQELCGAFMEAGPRPAAQVQGQADVLEARQRRQQVEELEDEPDGVSPDFRELVVRKAAEGPAADPHFAGGGPIEAADEIEQGRFPGPGRPDDRHHLTLGNGQGDAAQGADIALAGELFRDLVELNHVCRSGAVPVM